MANHHPHIENAFAQGPISSTSVWSAHPTRSHRYDKVRQSVTSKSKSKKHGPITGSDKNRSEPARACDWPMLSAFAFARNTLTHLVIPRPPTARYRPLQYGHFTLHKTTDTTQCYEVTEEKARHHPHQYGEFTQHVNTDTTRSGHGTVKLRLMYRGSVAVAGGCTGRSEQGPVK